MEGRVAFVFDECMSHKIAEALSHCGKNHNPVLHVTTLKALKMLDTWDPIWVRKCVELGKIVVSEDVSMIDDHDIARLVMDCGGTLILLSNAVSQQKRWQLLRWYAEHLPKLALVQDALQPGTTVLVGKEGRFSIVEPSSPLIQQTVPLADVATNELSI